MAGMEVSWGSYKAPQARTPLSSYPQKKKKPGGVLGFLGNLLEDVEETTKGIPAGLLHVATTRPDKTLKEIGAATWHDWAKLAHGDVGGWWHDFTEHPLAPILDIAGVATLGAGSAVRGVGAVGKLSGAIEKGGVVARGAEGSSIVKLQGKLGGWHEVGDRVVVGKGTRRQLQGDGAQIVERSYHSNPLIRMRQKGLEKAGNQLADKLGSAKWSEAGEKGHYELKGLAKLTGDERFINKKMDHQRADRAQAFRHSMYTAVHAAGRLFNKETKPAVRIHAYRELEEGLGNQLVEHAMAMGKKKSTRPSGVTKGLTYVADRKYWTKTDLPDPGKWTEVEHINGKLGKMAHEGNWLTDDPAKAMVNEKGQPLLVRKEIVEDYFNEGERTLKVLHQLWNKPTEAWKIMVLAYSPRFFINNVLGNSLMYFAATNPKAAVDGLYYAYKEHHGAKKAAADMQKAHSQMGGANAMIAELFPEGHVAPFKTHHGHVSAGFSGSEAVTKGAIRGLKHPGLQRAKQGLMGPTHTVAEDFVRSATFHHSIRRTPEYWVARAEGHNHMAAAHKASQVEGVREYTRMAINNVLGDYNYLSSVESKIKKVVPFYTWDRAIVRHTAQMVKDRPYEAAVMAAVGRDGADRTIDALGKVPDFMQGAIPLAGGIGILGSAKNGRKTILTTQGINPYATISELAGAAGSTFGIGEHRAGETLGSQLNPLAVGAIEYLGGHKLISDAPADKHAGGLLGAMYLGAFEQTPQLKLLDTLRKQGLHGGRPGANDDTPMLYQGDMQQQLLSLLGAPLKEYSPKAAKSLYDRQHPVNRKYRKREAKPAHPLPSSSLPGF